MPDLMFPYTQHLTLLDNVFLRVQLSHRLFASDTDYLQSENASAVSLTLPLQSEEYTSKTLFSFFDGLIPEGWLLKIVTDNWKIDSHDRFGVLLVACKDGIGNVSIREEKE